MTHSQNEYSKECLEEATKEAQIVNCSLFAIIPEMSCKSNIRNIPTFLPNLDPVTQSHPSSDKDCQEDLGMKNGILRKRFLRELAVLRRNADYRCVPYLDGF